MGYYFVQTEDGSPGLFDEDVDDIYHSSFGAYKEAFDKFIIPSQLERFKNKQCRVLDICYGIGYNTRALLKYNIENNLNIELKIDALELNRDLIMLSPFLKFKNPTYIDFEIDKFLLNSFLNENKLDLEFIKSSILKNKNFLTIYKPDFEKIIENQGYDYGTLEKLNAFLHNIYYHNITIRPKIHQKSPIFDKTGLKWHINDARKAVSNLKSEYDLIFLDAFTASKQPILWTKDFLTLLGARLNKNTGLITTYSCASPFRKALLDLDLYVGKFYKNKIVTTLASNNKNLLKYMLDKFELGLLNTRAGIPYEDKTLNLSSEEILFKHDLDMKNSNLQSTSSYYKEHKIRYNKKDGKTL